MDTLVPTNVNHSLYGNFCDLEVPSAKFYLQNISSLGLTFIVIGILCAVVLFFIFFFELYVVFKYISSDSSRGGQIAWLLGIYPITAMLSVVGACMPRAMPITNMFMLLYFARLLFVYIQLVVDLFGGRIAMASEVHGTMLKLSVAPFFCCCPCLPKINPTLKAIRRTEFLVYQAAVIRPLIFLACGAAWADLLGDVRINNTFFQVVSVINLLSTLTAMYGYNLFADMAAGPLKDFCIRTQMKLMQILIILCNLQGNILELMAGPKGPIRCDHILPASARASFFNYAMLPIESLLLSLGTAWFLRPELNAIFDLYPKWKRKPSAQEVNEFLLRRDKESQAVLANGQVVTKDDIRYLYIPHVKSAPAMTTDEKSPTDSLRFSITNFQDDGKETDV